MTYEAFVFLNNVGCTLLERQKYQEAMETFQDAIRVHQCFCKSRQHHQHQQQQKQTFKDLKHKNELMIQEKLRNASKRLAHSIYCCNNQTIVERNNNMMMIDPMIVLDITNDDDCIMKILRYGSLIDQIDFVIRISDYDLSSDCMNDRNWKLEYAILILNFGVACKRFSEVVTVDYNAELHDEYQLDDEYKDSLRNQATKLFHVSNSIVSEELCNLKLAAIVQMKSISGSNDQDHLRTILHTMLISMFTVSHISEVMYWCYSIEDGMKYHTKFEKLYTLFESLIKEYIKNGGSDNTTKHAAVA